MYEPEQELIDRLCSSEVTANDVNEYLNHQYQTAIELLGDLAVTPAQFFNGESDLDNYRLAEAWWPRMEALPAQHAFPTVYLLAWSYYEPSVGATFAERLNQRGRDTAAWLSENGFDPQNPNEEQGERKELKNREAQDRHRNNDDRVTKARDEWRSLMGQRDEDLDTFNERVKAAQEAYHTVCAERKERRAEWDEKIREAKKVHQELKSQGAE